MSNKDIYYFTGKVLALGNAQEKTPVPATRARYSPKIPSDPQVINSIIADIREGRINWNKFVFLASQHFVLQTVYIKLLANDLAGWLPPDLVAHLKEIYRLNLARNEKILQQCAGINRLLRSHDITPIFMKGSGNMLDGLYSDPGERIMADIDILTGSSHMEDAAKLLIASGYSTHEKYDPARARAAKHYPALWREGLPAFVEIHRLPVNIQYSSHFDFETVAHEKKQALHNPDYMVMSDAHKITLNFYHSQLVHWGHHHALPSLRDLYDLLLLSERGDPSRIFSFEGPHRRKAAGYLRVMHKTFGITPEPAGELPAKASVFVLRHHIAINNPRLGNIIYRLLRGSRLYIGIPLRGLFSRNYRLYIMVRLRDRRWYLRNLGIGKHPE
jgi:hypothetical protein